MKLTPEQTIREQALDKIISTYLNTSDEAAQAILEYRDTKLYKEKYATFEECVKAKWGLSRSRAYQLIDFANDLKQLVCTTGRQKPKNEHQSRMARASRVKDQKAIEVETTTDKAPEPTSAFEAIKKPALDAYIPDMSSIKREPDKEKTPAEKFANFCNMLDKLDKSFRDDPRPNESFLSEIKDLASIIFTDNTLPPPTNHHIEPSEMEEELV